MKPIDTHLYNGFKVDVMPLLIIFSKRGEKIFVEASHGKNINEWQKMLLHR